MRVEILGTEYECRALSATDRKAWSQYVHYEVLRTFYSDLHSRVESLPMPLQVAVFEKESPPDRVDPLSPDYYRVASTPAAVSYLLGLLENLTIDNQILVTKENAPAILLALRPLIFPEHKRRTVDQEAAEDTFRKLEEGTDNGG